MHLGLRVYEEMFLVIEPTNFFPGVRVGERGEPHHLVLVAEESLEDAFLSGEARGGESLAEVVAEFGQGVCVLMQVVKVQ